MTFRNRIVANALALVFVSSSGFAESPDPEMKLDEGLKRFGYLAGLARGCVADDQRPSLEREAVDLHGGIGRLLGTDRAFLFAAAFGNGTSVILEVSECKEVLERYETRVEDFRRNRGSVQ